MRTERLSNTSNKPINVKMTNGVEVNVPPGQTIRGFDIDNLDELQGKVDAKLDLTEVTGSSKKTLLHG